MSGNTAVVVLAVLNGDEKGRLIVVTANAPTTFGRGEDVDVMLAATDDAMSRRQASLERIADGWVLSDLTVGANPPRVNAERGARFLLRNGDEIRFGNTRLRANVYAGTALALRCTVCGEDVSVTANRDGQALALIDTATYRCHRHLSLADGSWRAVGKYRLGAKIGEGGAGTVHEAVDAETGRVVAFKELHDYHDIEKIRRFDREMDELSHLRHHNIVRFIDSGVDDENRPFMVTELVPDGNLSDLVRRHRSEVPVPLAVGIIVQALDGLRFLHGRERVHRDMKPENVLLRMTSGGHIAKLADFGLARRPDGLRLTRPQHAGGSFEFMPPEQVTDFSRLGPTADVYGLGATLYFLLSGAAPVDIPEGATQSECLRAVVIAERVPLAIRARRVPTSLAAVVDRACRMSVAARFPSAEAFQTALVRAT